MCTKFGQFGVYSCEVREIVRIAVEAIFGSFGVVRDIL